MTVLRQVLDDTAQVVDESHVHHGVGLVQHEVVQVLEVYEALVHEVQQATRRGDHDVDAAPQFLDLSVLAYAAKQRRREEFHMLRVAKDVILDLDGQLACGGQNQPTDGAELAAVPFEVKAIDHGQAECCRLACACLRYPEDVVSCEDFGNGLGLDGGWGFVTQLLDGLQHGWAEA